MHGKHHTQSLIAITTIFVLVLGLGVAYAEPPEHLLDDALEWKQLWERIEQLQSKVNQTEAEREELENAQEKFNEIRTLLNSYGMATPQQIEANPEYWRDYNYTPEEEDNPAVQKCDCPQKVKFKSGYKYKWILWWTSYEWASSWSYATSSDPYVTSTVVVDSGQNGTTITPYAKYKLTKSESAEFYATSRIQNEDGGLVRPPEGGNIALSGTGTLTMAYRDLPNAATGDELIIRVQITSIQ